MIGVHTYIPKTTEVQAVQYTKESLSLCLAITQGEYDQETATISTSMGIANLNDYIVIKEIPGAVSDTVITEFGIFSREEFHKKFDRAPSPSTHRPRSIE